MSISKANGGPLTSEIAPEEREAIFNKPRLMSFILILLFSNALLFRVANGIVLNGFLPSIADTFGVSALVWFGAYLSIKYASEIEARESTFLDKVVLSLALIVCVLPIGPLTWVFISVAAIYFIRTSKVGSKQYRSGWIALSLTIPMFWSHRLFSLFSGFFLSIDASMVAKITGTERVANLVAIPGGGGYLQIAAPCSSMANLSLAVLCWSIFTQLRNLQWHPRNIAWCGLSCILVMGINVTRISLIGFYPQHYEMLHGGIGATVAGWTTLVVIVYVSYVGVTGVRKQTV